MKRNDQTALGVVAAGGPGSTREGHRLDSLARDLTEDEGEPPVRLQPSDKQPPNPEQPGVEGSTAGGTGADARDLIVGVGCVRGATADEIDALISVALDSRGLVRGRIEVLASIDAKRDEPGIREIAARHGWELRLYTRAQLDALCTPLENRSKGRGGAVASAHHQIDPPLRVAPATGSLQTEPDEIPGPDSSGAPAHGNWRTDFSPRRAGEPSMLADDLAEIDEGPPTNYQSIIGLGEQAGDLVEIDEGLRTPESAPVPAVCEPAALLAAGPNGQLLVPKTRTRRVTVAIARAVP